MSEPESGAKKGTFYFFAAVGRLAMVAPESCRMELERREQMCGRFDGAGVVQTIASPLCGCPPTHPTGNVSRQPLNRELLLHRRGRRTTTAEK